MTQQVWITVVFVVVPLLGVSLLGWLAALFLRRSTTKKVENKTGRHCLREGQNCPFLNTHYSYEYAICIATASCELSERAAMQAFEWASKTDPKELKP